MTTTSDPQDLDSTTPRDREEPGSVARETPRSRWSLPVVEIIGPTVQGEGMRVGRRAALVRLGGCNLSCGSCDTTYSWDGIEPVAEMDNSEIMHNLARIANNHPIHHVVITGGEPLIHQSTVALRTLVVDLVGQGISVEVETNGTVVPAYWFQALMVTRGTSSPPVSFSVSPKIVSGLATDAESKRIKRLPIEWFAQCGCAFFKVVCRTTEDVTRVGAWADINNISRNNVWIMAEGATWSDHVTRARALADHILAEGMNVSPRLHLALWPTITKGR